MQRYGEILKRNWPLAIIAVFLLVVMAWRNAAPPAKYPIPEKSVEIETKSIEAQSGSQGIKEDLASRNVTKAEEIVIYITGAVKEPGVQKVFSDTRLYEVIEKAGGFLPEADKERINLAAKVEDGMHYIIPEKGQEVLPDIQPLMMLGGGAPAPGRSGDGKININQADKTALMELDGIGEVLAKRIIEYREKNGPFASPEELLQVSGIGDKKFEAIQDKITAP